MNKYVILCVDDESTILESLKIELKRAVGEEFLIETAESGEDALDILSELLEEQYEIPLVISDYLMPDIKGDELLKRIHSILPKTLKIMLTGQADIEAVGNAIRHAKLYRYIAKPWQTEDLKLTVSEAIHSYFQEQKLQEQHFKLQHLNEELETLVEQRTAELRLSEEKFAKAFRSTPHAITITKLNDGCHIEVNDSFCRMTGYTSEEIVGRTAIDLDLWVNLEDRNRLFQLLTNDGAVRDYEFNFRTKSGAVRTAVLSAEIIKIDDQTCVLTISQDITVAKRLEEQRQQTEEELRKSEERWQLVLRGNKDGIWDRNLKTGDVFRSSRWKEMLGYEDGEISNTWNEWIGRIHPDDFDRVMEANHKHLERKTPHYSVEYRLQCKDGTYRWIQDRGQALWDEQGNPARMVGSHTDITERKQAEEALRLTQFSLDNFADGAYWTGADGRFLYVNHGACHALGYTREELLEMSVPDIDANFTEEIWQTRFNTQKQHGHSSTFETCHCRKDGSTFPVEVTAQYLEFNGKEYICSFSRDISARKQAELALQQAKEAADRANRAKSEFLSNMSHELRTPLNAILGFTQLLSRDSSLKAEQQEHLGIINRSGEHLLTLINSILQMSKIEVGRVTVDKNTFDLYRLLNTLEEMLRLQAQNKGLQLIFDYSSDLPPYVRTDESKLRQVLINLLGNAIKFTSEGGVTLRVKAEHGSREELLMLDAQLVFEIEDTGPGIASSEIDNLFKPFVQTETGRKTQEGTGLGLPISRQFVQLMGGDITISSTVGQGSIFKFNVRVELADAAEIQTDQMTRRAIALASGQPEYRILVVDDRLESRLLLVKLLASLGFSVREAENGAQAVDVWSSYSPHLIWMDMRMPVMDGYEATKRIKAHLKGQATVIIALTASAFEEERSVVLSAGCDDFVAKPFREQVILEKMAHYLGVRYVYEELVSSPSSSGSFSSQPSLLMESQGSSFILQASSFQVMPSEWIDELYQAADSVDNEQIFQLISQIPSDYGDFVQALVDLVKNFRCDRIVDLIEELRNSVAS